MQRIRIAIAIVEFLAAAGSLFGQADQTGTNYGSLGTTDYGSLAGSADYGSVPATPADEEFFPFGESLGIPETAIPDEAQPTPYPEIHRILTWMKLDPSKTFLDIGCGYDARVGVAAASIYGCNVIALEIDPQRAESARRRVAALGLSDKIEVRTADATQEIIEADSGFAYLYPGVLEKLTDQILTLDRFASYLHDVPGVTMQKSGDAYFFDREKHLEHTRARQSVSRNTQTPAVATWGGYQYSGRVCSNPNCRMCNSIQSQLSTRANRKQAANTRGRWVHQCRNGRCAWYWVNY